MFSLPRKMPKAIHRFIVSGQYLVLFSAEDRTIDLPYRLAALCVALLRCRRVRASVWTRPAHFGLLTSALAGWLAGGSSDLGLDRADLDLV
jgi:hypothetical protein